MCILLASCEECTFRMLWVFSTQRNTWHWIHTFLFNCYVVWRTALWHVDICKRFHRWLFVFQLGPCFELCYSPTLFLLVPASTAPHLPLFFSLRCHIISDYATWILWDVTMLRLLVLLSVLLLGTLWPSVQLHRKGDQKSARLRVSWCYWEL